MKRALLSTVLLSLSLGTAQVQIQERGNMPGNAVVGKVTTVGADSLVVAPLMGGDPVTVKVSDSTRVSKDRQPIKLDEIKVDETVFARGELKNGVLEAVMVGVVNPQMIQRMEQGGQGGPGGPGAFNREDMGKKFIAGEVKAIVETKLTIARVDGQTQDIEVDENTSFKRGKESITLPDIKAGDFVRGPGELKDGVFVAKELNVGRPQMRFRIETGGPDGAPPQNPPGDKPVQTPPKN
jgi:Domain of unknown function (DUF5666)